MKALVAATVGAALCALLIAASPLGAGSTGALPPGAAPVPQAMTDAAGREGYIGAEACQACHPDQYADWKASRHSRMVQPARVSEVKARFTGGESLDYRGRTYRFDRQGPRFFIIEERPGGPAPRHEIEFTLGSRRIQHYLTRQPSGALVLLPPTWDVLREEWFPQEEIVPTGEPGVEPVQVWNKNCFGCHVSQERKRFDPATLTYETDWLDFGTNCETCHGPAREHAEFYLSGARSGPRPPLPSLARLDAGPFTQLCAQCHQNRYLVQAGYRPGEPFYDHFLTAMLYTVPADAPDPGYWVDGRTRRFSNNSFALWQSACFREGGVKCLDCHRNIHSIDIDQNPQLRPEVAGRELCAKCHAGLVERVERHSQHAAGSEASSCLSCHMPRTVSGVKATMRDHSLSVPVPENTLDYGVPNACTLCHAEDGARWAARRIEEWYGPIEQRPSALRLRRRARAFDGAQRGRGGGRGGGGGRLGDLDEPFLMRASAVGYLRAYAGQRALEGLWEALVDPHPAVRAVAALTVAEHPDGGALATELVPQLTDPSYIVRANAAFALARLGVGGAAGAVSEHLQRAQGEYLEHLRLYADSAPDQANAGAMLALAGQTDEAIEAYRTALRLDSDHADARFGLGVTLLQVGRRQEALEQLQRLHEQRPDYPGLEELLERLKGPDPGRR